MPVNLTVAEYLGLDGVLTPSTQLQLRIEVEHSVQEVRPDLLGHTDEWVAVAIGGLLVLLRLREVGSVCPAWLGGTRDRPASVLARGLRTRGGYRTAVLHDLDSKAWLWPKPPVHPEMESEPNARSTRACRAESSSAREIVTIAGR